MPELLFEIGTEELPASYLTKAIAELPDLIDTRLREAKLLAPDRPPHDGIAVTGTPRRLVVAVRDVAARQPDEDVEASGPAEKAAFDADGKPTKALLGFARGQGVDPGDVELRETPKGRYCFVSKRVEGRAAIDVLAQTLADLIDAIPFPKSMKWRARERTFARPVRWLLALLGEDVIPVEWNGIAADRVTRGHPFLAPDKIAVPKADLALLRKKLREQKVILDHEERQRLIETGLAEVFAHHGSHHHHQSLVAEVTNLVEHPHVQEASFKQEFLQLPREVLEAAMTSHQRYFPMTDADGQTIACFAFVSNRGPEQADTVRGGNERVLAARLYDAKFFFEQDQRHPLAERAGELADMLFGEKLGSYRDKTERLKTLAAWIAEWAYPDLDRAGVERAAELCKVDLLTEMVGEFPELQGVMGREYARRQGEPDEVALAIGEQYLPKGGEDDLPHTRTGTVLALAEKLDNIAGAFLIGARPTGSKDPFALRRQAAAVLRVLEEKELSGLDLERTVAQAIEGYAQQGPLGVDAAAGGEGAASERAVLDQLQSHELVAEQILEFLRDRLYHRARDEVNHRHDFVDAVLATGFGDVPDFWRRLAELDELAEEDAGRFDALLEVAERTYNITKKLEPGEDAGPSADLLAEDAEKQLHATLLEHEERIRGLLNEGKYAEAARRYREVFAAPVHDFFDKVFVMVEDADLRRNRQRLCRAVNRLLADRFARLDLVQRTTGE